MQHFPRLPPLPIPSNHASAPHAHADEFRAADVEPAALDSDRTAPDGPDTGVAGVPETFRWGHVEAPDAAPRSVSLGRIPQRPLALLARRAIAVPVGVGAAVFLAAVAATIILVWAPPGSEAAPFVESEREHSSQMTVDDPDAPETPPLLVHVSGEIVEPGVVEVETGSRVLDAIEAAGGATEHAVLDGINLARPLIDGEQLVVPNTDEAASAPASAPSTGGDGRVSLNSGTAQDFETLPRIGPALAARIVAWRTEHGGFATVDQLGEVSGIGEKTLAELRDLVTL